MSQCVSSQFETFEGRFKAQLIALKLAIRIFDARSRHIECHGYVAVRFEPVEHFLPGLIPLPRENPADKLVSATVADDRCVLLISGLDHARPIIAHRLTRAVEDMADVEQIALGI